MKRTIKKRKPLHAAISEERILTLMNDAAENIRSGTVEEWRCVARYWQDALQREINKLNAVQPSIATMVCALEMLAFAKAEMSKWQCQHYRTDNIKK